MKKYIKGIVKKDAVEKDLFEAIASTDAIDRDGETIDPKGWELENFKNNPVLLFAHDYKQPPVGKFVDIETRDDGLLGKFKFASTERAQELKTLVKEGILNTLSVGFMTKESDAKDAKKITKQELLEVSLVPVPSNAEAVITARSKGLNLDLVKMDNKTLNLVYKDLDKRVVTLEKSLEKNSVKKEIKPEKKKVVKTKQSEKASDKEVLRKALQKVATGLGGCLYELKKGTKKDE